MNGYQPEGIFSLHQARTDGALSLSSLEYAKEKRKILEAPVLLCDKDMNLHVALGEGIGIIPKNEVVYPITAEDVKDIAILTRVGKTVCFHVEKVDMHNEKPVALLSRRSAQRECYEKKVATLRAGDIIKARVTHLEPFGAFLDIGCGIISLLPIDCISVSRISHPSVRLSVGDLIDVVVKSNENGRVYVSRKELLGTWEENAALFSAGQTVAGAVRSIESYGIFIELTPNLTGLAELRDGVSLDDLATVYIKSILPEKMKIKLIVLDFGRSSIYAKSPTLPSFMPKEKHIDHWRYSPLHASKTIETYF